MGGFPRSTVQVIKNYVGCRRRRRSSSTRTAAPPTTPRPWPRRAAPAPASATRSRRRSPWARIRTPGLHRDDRLWAGPATAVHRRCLRRHLPGRGRRDPDLHAHEHGAWTARAVHRAGDQELRGPRRRRSSSTRTAAPPTTPRPWPRRSGASASFSYPLSTQVTVGEDPVPPGFTATIAWGRTRHSRTPAVPSPSPPRPWTARP